MIEGEFEFTVAGEKHIMKPGKVFVLPTNIPHGGRALTPCRIIDVFHPVREDYR
jgi:quercetin dioxygenase-like cupin family protein